MVSGIQALTMDTGGTILDWHSGFRAALAEAGARHGVERDWSALTNDLRRRSMRRVLRLGETEPPRHNFDDAHRAALDEVLADNGLDMFSEDDRHEIAYTCPHTFTCWPDFPTVLPRLRAQYICASFTLLSFRMIIDTARANGLSWDAVISCEGIGTYKPLPEAYATAARYLQLRPEACCMVACHGFDLDAARAVGFQTAFVRRPEEWGPEPPAEPAPDAGYTFVVEDFRELAAKLGAA